MADIQVIITKTITKNVKLTTEDVEKILENYAQRELGFANPDVTIDTGYGDLREVLISSTEQVEDDHL